MRSGEVYQKIGQYDFILNKTHANDYVRLLDELLEHRLFPRQIIHYTDLSNSIIHPQIEHGYYDLFYLAQALIRQNPSEVVRILSLNEIAQEQCSPFTEALSGLAKTIHLEHPKIVCQIVHTQKMGEQNIEFLLQELSHYDIEVHYDSDDKRSIKCYEEVAHPKESNSQPVLKKNGVYLITGGAGGIGLLFARYLAERYQAKLVLIGRSELNEKQNSNMDELKNLGADVLYVRADVTKQKDLKGLLKKIKQRFGALNGVIHSAGVLHDALILKKTREEITEVLAPKIAGTQQLDEVTQAEPLDFFVMFSSTASIFGNIGQSDYAYANSFMDAYAGIEK